MQQIVPRMAAMPYHPEAAVVGIKRYTKLALNVLRPQGRVVAPVAVPLEVAPRIANVNQAMRPSLLHSQQAVRVATDESRSTLRLATALAPLVFAGRRARHHVPAAGS